MKAAKAAKDRHEEMPVRQKLLPGTLVSSAHGCFQIVEVIGEGGYSDVYRVMNGETKEYYALKVEFQNVKAPDLCRLAFEVQVLLKVSELPEARQKYFASLVSFGQNLLFKFVIMELVGDTLSTLQRCQPGFTFGLEISFKLSIGCIEAIKQLHELGFVHRDIKPNNFVMGTASRSETVVIIDFGISRRYVDHKKNIVRKARPKVAFNGTLRYASRSSMHKTEQGRKDDMESLFYTLLELYSIRALFWWPVKDPRIVYLLKKAVFDREIPYIEKFPSEYSTFMSWIDKKKYYDDPDYQGLKEVFINGLKRRSIDPNGPLAIQKNFSNEPASPAPPVKDASSKKQQKRDEVSEERKKPTTTSECASQTNESAAATEVKDVRGKASVKATKKHRRH